MRCARAAAAAAVPPRPTEPFLTGLAVGPATVETGKETLLAALSAGFAEVGHDHVTVMVGSCEFAHEIDRERAEVAAERAKRQLEEMRASEEGEEVYMEYQESYSRAITRVAVSERFKN